MTLDQQFFSLGTHRDLPVSQGWQMSSGVAAAAAEAER